MRVVVCLTVLFLTLSCVSPDEAPADLILRGGNVVTMDEAVGNVEALAARDGVVIAVGTNAEIEALTGPDTQVIDLNGRTAIPGFTEAPRYRAAWRPDPWSRRRNRNRPDR